VQYHKIRDKELWNINDVGRCALCCQPVDDDDKRAILVQDGEGSAEIVRLQHGALHRIVRQRRKCHTFAACPIPSSELNRRSEKVLERREVPPRARV